MKQFLVLILAVLVSCGNPQSAEHDHGKNETSHDHGAGTVPLNGDRKWKADEATKENVAAMMTVVSDAAYADAGKRTQLVTDLQGEIDTLIEECTMEGPEHDALHVWLEQILQDVKALKEEDTEYAEGYSTLKRDIAGFYEAFE